MTILVNKYNNDVLAYMRVHLDNYIGLLSNNHSELISGYNCVANTQLKKVGGERDKIRDKISRVGLI